MTIKTKGLAINSILIVITTSIIGIILHESAHYVVGYYLNLKPELHRNYVQPMGQGTEMQYAILAGSGPLFSFIFGTAILFISFKYLKPSLTKLFMTWLGMGNLLLLFGYFLIAPIVKNGDTGLVLVYLRVPTFIIIAIAIVSFLSIRFLFSKFSGEFIFYKHDLIFDKVETQKQLFIFPIVGSILIATALNFPTNNWISLLPTIFMPISFISTLKNYSKIENIEPEITINKVSQVLIVLTLLTIILFRSLG